MLFYCAILAMQDWERKINKLFIDFIIGSCYLGERVKPFHDKIKKIVMDAYKHLEFELSKIVEWREKD